jgi:hypothetical protein
MSPEDEAVASQQRQQVAQMMVGGLGIIGLGFLVKVGLDQANKQSKSGNGYQGGHDSSRSGNRDHQDWTYLPPSN